MIAGEFKYIETSLDTPEVRHMKKCLAHGIEIVVEPTPSKLCRVHVTHNNRIIVRGEKYFSQYPTNGKSPLAKKVRELYAYYYEKILKKEKKLKNSTVI